MSKQSFLCPLDGYAARYLRDELIDGAMNELHQCGKPQCRRIYNLLKVRNGKKQEAKTT
ncbi:hypothetical protein LCGC14_1198050 [marine sediment metagenome]|uniref:Uncharacterized protein n=1 Tax=marine sediment metagenome TaxID=412755 RepID=A0A0F9LHR0_9ZZZZ